MSHHNQDSRFKNQDSRFRDTLYERISASGIKYIFIDVDLKILNFTMFITKLLNTKIRQK